MGEEKNKSKIKSKMGEKYGKMAELLCEELKKYGHSIKSANVATIALLLDLDMWNARLLKEYIKLTGFECK